MIINNNPTVKTMKRTLLLAITALAALLASSCQKDDLGRVLTATIEQYEHNASSKAYINTENYACWENNDKVNINGHDYTISISGGNGHNYSASIPGTESLEGDLLAFYPASQVSSWNGDNVTISLPQVQTYEERNGHQIINNPMAAYCPADSNELRFRNLPALLKITICATEDLQVRAIQVKGDDDQMLWGTSQLTLDYQDKPLLGKMSNGASSVLLTFEKPAEIRANDNKSFYIVVPAGSDFIDFTIAVMTNQATYLKTRRMGQTVPRNHIGALSYTLATDDKVYAILYTGSIDGLRFNYESFGGVLPESSADGVIRFNYPIATIGEMAFSRRDNLTSVILPAGVTSIGGYAFCYCINLSSISLPASLTSIGVYAFGNCSSLTSVSLPQSLTEIKNTAFRSCSNLARIDCYATIPPDLGDDVFDGIPSTAVLHVPTGKADTYSGSNWGTVFSEEGRIIEDL